MERKKTLEINTFYLKTLFISLLVSTFSVFIYHHFGEFSFSYTQKEIRSEDGQMIRWETDYTYPVLRVHLEPPIGESHTFLGYPWLIKDVLIQSGDFHLYSNKVKYYLIATKNDWLIILFLSFLGVLFSVIFKKYRFSFV